MMNGELIYNAIWEREEQEEAIKNMAKLEQANKKNGYNIPTADLLYGDEAVGDLIEEAENYTEIDF